MKVLGVFKKVVTFIEHDEVVTKIGDNYSSKPAVRAKRGVFRLYNAEGTKIVDPREVMVKQGNKKVRMFEAGKEPIGINLVFTDTKAVDLKTGKECVNLYEMEVE